MPAAALRLRLKTPIAALLAALAILGSPPAPAAAPTPRIVGFEYYEDYERIGYHRNVDAAIKGPAERVTARLGRLKAAGRPSKKISSGKRKTLWFFRDRPFVKAVRADLEADGVAKVKVTAVNGSKRAIADCGLVFEPDPEFGDYGRGDCRRR